MQEPLLTLVQRIQAIAHTGLTFSSGPYDLERYEDLRKLSNELFSLLSKTPVQVVEGFFQVEPGYQTPKVDVRALVLEENKVLLVQEKADGRWSLPGGWADVGYTPSEIAAKEVWEETQLQVRPQRLLAVYDKRCHPHPPYPEYTYKLCFLCEAEGGDIAPGLETADVGYFEWNRLPAISEERITPGQIQQLYHLAKDAQKPPHFD